MTPPFRQWAAAMFLASTLLACTDSSNDVDRSPAPPKPEVNERAVQPDQRTAAEVSTAWLQALERKEWGELERLSALPFVQGGPAMAECAGTASTASERRAAIRCVVDNEKLLIEELRWALQDHMPLTETSISLLRPHLKSFISGTCSTVVSGFINGDGVTFAFVFCLKHEGHGFRVTKFILDAEFPA